MEPGISSGIPEGCCVFCDSSSQSVERYGKFLHHEESGIYAHYYCMLFACGLSQRGQVHEGLEGFLVKDILAERRRAQKLKCKYCKKKGASIGCSVKACHQIYHYECGLDEGAIFLFYDSFVSYCVKHRPVQKVLPSSCSPSKGTCPICMENVDTTPGIGVLKTPCCKGTWLHRECVQMQALSAGYFFRCAICNNENEFQDEMRKFGIYLPEKDADWEIGGEAYQELYERHSRCDVDKCRCPKGRKYCTQSGQWEIVLCDLCGSAGCHVACGGLVTAMDDWACRDCTSTFTRGLLPQNPAPEAQGTAKTTSSTGYQLVKTPSQNGPRARSALRSQGKRPRHPPTTPRPVKKTKQSSTPVCPPLSPVSSQKSSISSSPRITPGHTIKFPRVSLSPTYERIDSGSSERVEVDMYKELLPKLDCYVSLGTPSRDTCPNLSMPSLSPASTSAKKRKSSNSLKYKKARKLDLNSCTPSNDNNTTLPSSKEQGNCLQVEDSNSSSDRPSWGSRLLDSVGSFLWRRKSPSKSKSPESTEVNLKRVDKDDTKKGLPNLQKDVASLPSSSKNAYRWSYQESNSPVALSEQVKSQIVPLATESVPVKTKNMLHDLTSWKDDSTWKEAKADLAQLFQVDGRATRSALKKDENTPTKTKSQNESASSVKTGGIANNVSVSEDKLHVQRTSNRRRQYYSYEETSPSTVISEKMKSQIVRVDPGSVPVKTQNMLHDLTSWKDDSTWKEAKEDLAQLFQVHGRATRSALKKGEKTPFKSSAQGLNGNLSNRSMQEDKAQVQSDSKGHCHIYSYQESDSVVLSEKIKSQIIPLTPGSVPIKTKNMLNDLTSWKDDSTWKEAKDDLAQLFQIDGRATRSALKKDEKTLVKVSHRKRREKVDVVESVNIDDVRKMPSNDKSFDISSLKSDMESCCSGQQSRSSLKEDVKQAEIITPICSPARKKRKLGCHNSPSRDTVFPECPSQNHSVYMLRDSNGKFLSHKKQKGNVSEKDTQDMRASSHDSILMRPCLIYDDKQIGVLERQSQCEQMENGTIMPKLSEKVSKELQELTSWKNGVAWKEVKGDLPNLSQHNSRTTRNFLGKEAESSSLAKSPHRKSQVLGSSVLTPQEETREVNQHDAAGKMNHKGPEEETSLNESCQNTESNKVESDKQAYSSDNSSCSGQKPQKRGTFALKTITEWKNNQTWKELRGDMEVLLQINGRTTRQKAQKEGIIKTCDSPKAGNGSMSQSVKKGPFSSVISANTCPATQMMHGEESSLLETQIQIIKDMRYKLIDQSVRSETKRQNNNIRRPHSERIQGSASCGKVTSSRSKEALTEKTKSRKSLLKAFQSDTEGKITEDKSTKFEAERRQHPEEKQPSVFDDLNESKAAPEQDDLFAANRERNSIPDTRVSPRKNHSPHKNVPGEKSDNINDIAGKASNHEKEVVKPVLLNQASQTEASVEEVEAYVNSMGMLYRETRCQPANLRKTIGNYRTGHTQTYKLKYHRTISTTSKEQCSTVKNMLTEEAEETLDSDEDEITFPKKDSVLKGVKPGRAFPREEALESLGIVVEGKGGDSCSFLTHHANSTKHQQKNLAAFNSTKSASLSRNSPRKRFHQSQNVHSQEEMLNEEVKSSYDVSEYMEDEKNVDSYPANSDISSVSTDLMVAGLPTGCPSDEKVDVIPESVKICKSLVDDIIQAMFINSKCRNKKTEEELLQSWAKDGLWKEANDDLQTLLLTEERITRKSRKDQKETDIGELPVIKDKRKLNSPSQSPKPSPLRKKKYCCSHMRSPWQSSPSRSQLRKTGAYCEKVVEVAYVSPSSDSKKLSTPSKANAIGTSVEITPVGQTKVWKPRVHHSGAKTDRPKAQALSATKKKPMPSRQAESEGKYEGKARLQESSRKKLGSPHQKVVDETKQETLSNHTKQRDEFSETKRRSARKNADIFSEQMTDRDNTDKSTNVVKEFNVHQSCQNTVEKRRNFSKARRRLDSASITKSADSDLENCTMGLQEIIQVGTIETRNVSIDTDATKEEVEAYIASKGKLYFEPCVLMSQPSLEGKEATAEMSTQTYNALLSRCLADETKQLCPSLLCENGKSKNQSSSPNKKRLRKSTVVNSNDISSINKAISPPVTSSILSSSRMECSSQTELPMEEVEAHIQLMGECYREPSTVMTGLHEDRTDGKKSLQTQTFNLHLPEKELPMFKKKYSKRVHNLSKSTQTKETWEKVNAYIEANKQLYIDPNYFATQSYFLVGSMLTRHISTQTYCFSPDTYECEETSMNEQLNPGENGNNPKKNSRESSQQTLPKLKQTEKGEPSSTVIGKTKTDSSFSGSLATKKNWFRLKPKK